MSDEPPRGWVELDPSQGPPRIGGDELTERRRDSIEEVLRLMACTHPLGESCVHVDAIGEMSAMLLATHMIFAADAIHTLPRPLTMPAIVKLLSSIEPVVALGGGEGTPRGLAE